MSIVSHCCDGLLANNERSIGKSMLAPSTEGQGQRLLSHQRPSCSSALTEAFNFTLTIFVAILYFLLHI